MLHLSFSFTSHHTSKTENISKSKADGEYDQQKRKKNFKEWKKMNFHGLILTKRRAYDLQMLREISNSKLCCDEKRLKRICYRIKILSKTISLNTHNGSVNHRTCAIKHQNVFNYDFLLFNRFVITKRQSYFIGQMFFANSMSK